MKRQESVEVVAQFIPTTHWECRHGHLCNKCENHQHKEHRIEKSNTNMSKMTNKISSILQTHEYHE